MKLPGLKHYIHPWIYHKLRSKEKTVVTSWANSQNDNFLRPRPYCVILRICSALQKDISFWAWDKSRDPTANWRRLEDMETTLVDTKLLLEKFTKEGHINLAQSRYAMGGPSSVSGLALHILLYLSFTYFPFHTTRTVSISGLKCWVLKLPFLP